MSQPKPVFSTTVRLGTGHVAWLTRTALTICKPSAIGINRSSLLRALIDGIAAARLDLSECSSQQEVQRMIADRLGANGKATRRAQ
jgi:hypothetical protein